MTASRSDALDRGADEERLIGQRLHLEAGWQAGQHPGNGGLDVPDHVERRGVAGLLDDHQRRALAVHAHDVGLRRVPVADVRDVADVDRRACRPS